MKKHGLLVAIMLIWLLAVKGIAAQAPADGVYLAAVTLSGGSGRAQIQSPAKLQAVDGHLTAVIVWSSPYYEFMLLGQDKYLPINTEGNSSFEIPIVLDTDLVVRAQTIAMSTPHMIEYTLHFDSSTIKPFDSGTGSAPNLLMLAAASCLALTIGAFALIRYQKAKQHEENPL